MMLTGTAANICALRSLAERHESVMAASDSHLVMDECGGPEASGKCLVVVCVVFSQTTTSGQASTSVNRLSHMTKQNQTDSSTTK